MGIYWCRSLGSSVVHVYGCNLGIHTRCSMKCLNDLFGSICMLDHFIVLSLTTYPLMVVLNLTTALFYWVARRCWKKKMIEDRIWQLFLKTEWSKNFPNLKNQFSDFGI